MSADAKYFLPYQVAWIKDDSRLKIVEKSRQIGFSYADSYDSVRKVAPKDAKLDVWVSSRDEIQAKQYLLYAKRWARVLNYAAEDLGEVVVDRDKDLTAQVLKFANGLAIYSLSSNPDAIAGKTGHVKIDEFALRSNELQRQAYAIGKPATQWGGTFTVISTHRGVGSVFNGLITDIKERNNPMGWSLHSCPIQRAVAEGIVEKINKATGASESREDFLARLRRECIDEEQWLQEYCCIPADEASAFLSYDLIAGCEYKPGENWQTDLADAKGVLYGGTDVGRVNDLTVHWVIEKLGDVAYTRRLIIQKNQTFDAQEDTLYSLLKLPQVRRWCIDNTGIGRQFAERAQKRFGYKVEPVNFTGPVKEELAYPVRAAFEDKSVRIPNDAALRSDLRAIRKETTAAGNLRFTADAGPNGHSDRFWALALALHAAKATPALHLSVL